MTKQNFQFASKQLDQLRSDLHALPKHPAGDHLDAEQIIDYVLGTADPEIYSQLDQHIASCPGCTEKTIYLFEYFEAQDVDLEEENLTALRDRISVHLRELTLEPAEAQPPPGFPLREIIQASIDRGQQFVHYLGKTYILFGESWRQIQSQSVAFSQMGGKDDPLLHRVSATDEESGWEFEVTAFAEDETACFVEVAIFQPDFPDADIENISVTLMYDEVSKTSKTDAGGVAEFREIPRRGLEQLVICVLPQN